MPSRSNRLSAVEVKGISRKGMYHDGGGLYLLVGAGGAKSWIYRFMLDGRPREMGLYETRCEHQKGDRGHPNVPRCRTPHFRAEDEVFVWRESSKAFQKSSLCKAHQNSNSASPTDGG
jgi:hypothetical protein